MIRQLVSNLKIWKEHDIGLVGLTMIHKPWGRVVDIWAKMLRC